CQVTQGAPGTITITIPKADVTEPNPISSTLYWVAFSTQTVEVNADTNPQGLIGGQLPNLIDVAPAFDFNEALVNVPELPWVPPVVIAGAALAAFVLRRRAGT